MPNDLTFNMHSWVYIRAATTGLEGPSAPGVDGTSDDEAEANASVAVSSVLHRGNRGSRGSSEYAHLLQRNRIT